MVPSLRMVVTPPVPFCVASAMPVRPSRFSPSTPVVPRMTPPTLLVTLTLLADALPMTAPDDSTESRPSSDGSIVPLLFSWALLPVMVSAVSPSSTPTPAPGSTFTVVSSAAVEKLGANGLAAPEQVTVEPAVVHTAQAGCAAQGTAIAIATVGQTSLPMRAGPGREPSVVGMKCVSSVWCPWARTHRG